MTAIPDDLKAALAASGLLEFFAGCTAAHQREYLKWIGEAKRPETRRARIGQATKRLAEKRAEEHQRAQSRLSRRGSAR